ncbi:hypothetical protein GH975_09200 [Litorivicinus lipolyticus]|uniref:SoxR reducing system protein RseC n=1 Tax=Litorivicinus lipolyticus TaxID=418701 RepID=A0A5Q2QI80_9GAMM|nr:SoxR reducing system RseC family protein [Litorivicinus lipolyticus]QGG80735.1 hypothetical protein GH975_09200 [Litorivicinus lipolyticus]
MTPVNHCDTQPGKIIAERPGQVAVMTHARGGCGRCRQPGGCGRPMDERPTTTWIDNEAGFEVGDAVELNVATPALEKAAWSAYGIPLAGLIVGGGLGVAFGDAVSVALGLAGLWLGLGYVRLRSHRLAPQMWITPVNKS